MRGYSLLESLIFFSITGILAGLTAPSLFEIKEVSLLRHATRQIQHHLQRTHSEAMSSNKTLEISLHTLHEQVPDCELTFHRDEIVFYPGGTTSPGTLRIKKNGRVCRLTLSLRGRIKFKCYGSDG